MPAVPRPTLAFARLHGRKPRTWYKKVAITGKQLDDVYRVEELSEWVPRVAELARHASEVRMMFNNYRRNYATVNAEMLQCLLGQIDRPPETGQGLPRPLLADGA